jgi:hypothetical protein
VTRHDAKWSRPVLDVLAVLLNDEAAPVVGPLVDPFAGVAHQLVEVTGRADWWGIELEAEWAAVNDWVRHGDALDRSCYPAHVGAVVTSVSYGNRFSDQYLGPVCRACDGQGWSDHGHPGHRAECVPCNGVGRVGRGRYSYAISLGRKVSAGSSAGLQWGPKYRAFHHRWLKTLTDVIEPGPRRLILNVSDHYRARQRQYVCSWWLRAAHEWGFRLVEAWPAETVRMAHGRNAEKRAEREMVFVFDYLSRAFEQ